MLASPYMYWTETCHTLANLAIRNIKAFRGKFICIYIISVLRNLNFIWSQTPQQYGIQRFKKKKKKKHLQIVTSKKFFKVDICRDNYGT